MPSIGKTTFAEDILEVANGEPIEAISVSPNRRWFIGEADHELGPGPVAWEQALPALSYYYCHNGGFGGQDCHNFHAWTATRVLFVHEYDGSTYIISVPRNPQAFQ